MKLLFEPAPVFFMHALKTGGMALGDWLRSNYGRGYIDVGARRLAGHNLAELQQFRCYHSWHYGLGMLELIGRTDLATITLLRDPVERIVSDFLASRRNSQGEGKMLACHELQDMLWRALPYMQANVQTRLLGTRADYTALLRQDVQPDGIQLPILRPLDSCDRTPPPFSAASVRLDDMSIVGLTERYTDSMILMADLLGLPVPARLPSANVNPQCAIFAMRYRDQLDADIVLQLEELDCLDMELYSHATELFVEQWARYQARPLRTYSIAPRLRVLRSRAKTGIHSLVSPQSARLGRTMDNLVPIDLNFSQKNMQSVWPLSIIVRTQSSSCNGEVLALDDFKCRADSVPDNMIVRHDCLAMSAANGLHDCEGRPIAESWLQRGTMYPWGAPQKITVSIGQLTDHIDTMLFLPFANFQHFGHMLTETVGWLSTLLDPDVDPLGETSPDTVVLLAANSMNAIGNLCELLHLPAERVISTNYIRNLARCRRVLIPRPSMINQRVVESRHFPAVRRFVDRWYGLDSDTARDRLDRLRNPSTGSMDRAKVYLSRSRLPARLRHVRGEEELERELEKFGWRIVYPETLPILEQLETLHSARAVAGCIGSAFHLLMYFGMDIANKLVIGLGAIDGKMSPTYVLQFRQQGLNFLHICCLEPARFMKKSKGGSRQQNLAFSVPPRAIALQMEQLTCQHS